LPGYPENGIVGFLEEAKKNNTDQILIYRVESVSEIEGLRMNK